MNENSINYYYQNALFYAWNFIFQLTMKGNMKYMYNYNFFLVFMFEIKYVSYDSTKHLVDCLLNAILVFH